ncbi:hypothetical protein G6F22_021614 [Rhizopus arrhizus]|nr:hypothetical protein G6F22_021614 [Rhizopus arrhizus]
MHFDLADRQALARLHHPPAGDKAVALGRRQEVHLELRGQDVLAGPEQREGRVAARAVRNRRGDPRMQKAVLLAQVGALALTRAAGSDGD